MTLHEPFKISARLLPAVQIGNDWLSIEIFGYTSAGRTKYRFYLDTPNWEESGDNLRSGCGGGSIQEGMESLLAFLGAAAESYAYRLRTGRQGENEDLFTPQVVEWAYQNSGEISMIQCELEENKNLIEP